MLWQAATTTARQLARAIEAFRHCSPWILQIRTSLQWTATDWRENWGEPFPLSEKSQQSRKNQGLTHLSKLDHGVVPLTNVAFEVVHSDKT
jgi:hypothetical protein